MKTIRLLLTGDHPRDASVAACLVSEEHQAMDVVTDRKVLIRVAVHWKCYPSGKSGRSFLPPAQFYLCERDDDPS